MEVLQLKSFDHVHPHDLIFCEKEAVIHLNGREEIFCCGCSKSLADDSFYCCGECYFFLHKTCAELPPMIKHPLHNQHPLILHPNSPYGHGSACDICGLNIACFLYNCSDCNFDLDLNCAWLARCFSQPESHKHHFTKWCRPDPFTCNLCGTYSAGYARHPSGDVFEFPWICTNCHVVVHNRCMSLPITVHLPQHDHPLIHTYFIPQSQSITLICGICGKEVNREFGCYSCQNCPHVVHADCAMDNVQQVGQKFWAEEIEETENQLLEQEIEHFSHPHHKLFLVQHDDHGIATKCDGCMTDLISCPFYKCLECEFSLHIKCSKLPKHINHPLHKEHLLTLVSNNDKFPFFCRTCRHWCHGFSYRCLSCKYFKIDVRCALVKPFEFYHDSHKHPLSLFTQSNHCSQCASCGKDKRHGYMLRCKEQCPFALDYGCATLPRTFKYEYDDNSLVLSYHGNDDSNGFPYCDICEKDRDPNLWFYGCPNYTECPIYVHPNCAHGDHPYVKLGTSIKVFDLHEHELFFIQRNENFLPCQLCSENDQELTLNVTRRTAILTFIMTVYSKFYLPFENGHPT